MKTTVVLDDALVARLKREAARQNRNMSEIVEMALHLLFKTPRRPARPPKLPRYNMGKELVDLADRDALYDAMEGR
jgi:hypothetical protein